MMRGDNGLWREITAARRAAHAKHGANSIEVLSADAPDWLSVLMEEVGEVAHALTYDARDPGALRAELVDVLAVGSAWVAALDAAALVPDSPASSEGVGRWRNAGDAVVADAWEELRELEDAREMAHGAWPSEPGGGVW